MNPDWPVIACGVIVAAAGSYLLLRASELHRSWVAPLGVAALVVGAAFIASNTLRPTGSIPGLLGFVAGGTLVLGAATMAVLCEDEARRLCSISVGGAATAGLLWWSGLEWSVVLVVAVASSIGAFQGWRGWGRTIVPGRSGSDLAPAAAEPLAACAAVGLAAFVMLATLSVRPVSQWNTSGEHELTIDGTAWRDNQIMVGVGVIAVGAVGLLVGGGLGRLIASLCTVHCGALLLVASIGSPDPAGATAIAFAVLVTAAMEAVAIGLLTRECDRAVTEASDVPNCGT